MAHSVTYKMPKARSESKFVVYPFTQGARMLKLQSQNHCIIVDTQENCMMVSKRFAQYPRFEFCQPSAGGKIVDIPAEVQAQLNDIINAPTGNVVKLGA